MQSFSFRASRPVVRDWQRIFTRSLTRSDTEKAGVLISRAFHSECGGVRHSVNGSTLIMTRPNLPLKTLLTGVPPHFTCHVTSLRSVRQTGDKRLGVHQYHCAASFSQQSQSSAAIPDQSLQGRYASALFRVASKGKKLDEVYADLDGLRTLTKTCADFKLFVETPGLNAAQKLTFIEEMVKKYNFADYTSNFLKVIVENKRLSYLVSIFDAFEELYRHAKGEIKCQVISAEPLQNVQTQKLLAALQKRYGEKAKVIVEYSVSPAIKGGFIVRFGDQVLDYSVGNRIERLQSQLLSPLQS